MIMLDRIKFGLFVLGATFCLYSCSSKPTQAQTITVNNTQISVYFSPNGGASNAIVREINNAHHFVDIAMYDLTSRPISRAIIDAYKRGVKVRLVMDVRAANTRFSKSRLFYRAGIPIKTLPTAQTGRIRNRGRLVGLMHNKFAVIDGKEVITGSYNWTASAEKLNYENLLIIKSQKLADIYERYFNRMFSTGNNFKPEEDAGSHQSEHRDWHHREWYQSDHREWRTYPPKYRDWHQSEYREWHHREYRDWRTY